VNNPTAALARLDRCAPAHDQRGVALVMALVILLVLTILGVAAMNTTTLEERMAGSSQEVTRAFEAAESGVNSALGTAGVMNLNQETTNTFSYTGATRPSAEVVTKWIQYSPPKRGSGYSAQMRAANFKMKSTGRTNANAKLIVNQGVGQIMPR
jgi:type IV pilus assembly protein PilX